MKTLNLNTNALALLETIARGIKVKVDTKNPSVRSNIGVLLRKGYIIRTVCVGGNRYDASEEIRKMFLKVKAKSKDVASSVKKAAKKKSASRMNFISAETIRVNADFFLKLASSIVKNEKMYNNNVEFSTSIKGVSQIEFRSSNMMRIIVSKVEHLKAFNVQSTVKSAKNGKRWFIDIEITKDNIKSVVASLKKMES